MIFFNKLKHLGKSLDNKKKRGKEKKKQKRYVKCQWKELGRLQGWHLNCNDLAGNLRLIKYGTRLDWWSGSIIITTQRGDLQEDSPWGPKKAQTRPQRRHLRISTEALPIPLVGREGSSTPGSITQTAGGQLRNGQCGEAGCRLTFSKGICSYEKWKK